MQIDPWSSSIIDYDRLVSEFGIERMGRLDEILSQNHLFRRGIVFGHRDFYAWWNDFRDGKKVSILTGMMPSGPFHLGHKMVVDQLVFYQNLGVPVTLAIADVEARTVRRKTPEEIRENTINYLTNYFALGLDPDKTDIYMQSSRSVAYYRLANMLAGKVTFAEMEAIYGTLSPGKITSALIQAADILHKQLSDYDGKHRVLVPVGPDQDPHIRLARDLAERIGFVTPSPNYHLFMAGLDGQKMSSSRPTSYVSLDEPVEEALRKIKNALTGGRNTLEEQKKLGGQPGKCMIFSLYVYHFENSDESLDERRRACENGTLMCGECKKELLGRVEEWLLDVKAKKIKYRPIAEKLVDKMMDYPF